MQTSLVKRDPGGYTVLIRLIRRLEILLELWDFLRQRKRWWLSPLVLTLVLVGGLMAVAQASTVFPFLYPLF